MACGNLGRSDEHAFHLCRQKHATRTSLALELNAMYSFCLNDPMPLAPSPPFDKIKASTAEQATQAIHSDPEKLLIL